MICAMRWAELSSRQRTITSDSPRSHNSINERFVPSKTGCFRCVKCTVGMHNINLIKEMISLVFSPRDHRDRKSNFWRGCGAEHSSRGSHC